ncbi:MAG TPA: class I SAM-dependent methyltransferase [Croceibacterium sp.]
MPAITLDSVTQSLSRHAGLYRRRRPVYQTVMLTSLSRLWQEHHARVLDVGGGTGVMAQAIQELLPAGRVCAVDVVDRYFETLSVDTRVYDGACLPFADGSFEAATINNVMHHVPVAMRGEVMREVRRVVTGPVYIKDHVAASWLDHRRLAILDAIGNIPFGGQIDADYLSQAEWERLALDAGYRIAARTGGEYRKGPMAWLFPNQLETTMRFEPA